jgi:hypothetical protein
LNLKSVLKNFEKTKNKINLPSNIVSIISDIKNSEKKKHFFSEKGLLKSQFSKLLFEHNQVYIF